MSAAKVEESFTSVTAGSAMNTDGAFNISIDFTSGSGVGTVALERSFDGSTWHTVKEYTADAQEVGDCPERIKHRLNCTAYTSGTISGRLSQSINR